MGNIMELRKEWRHLMSQQMKGEPRDFTKLREIAKDIDGIDCTGTDQELMESVMAYFYNMIKDEL